MTAMNIPLRGLHCMGCARKVEKALNTDHQVEIHQLTPDAVTLDSDASFRQLAQSIEQAGYHAGHHYELSLSGLHCGNCVNKLKTKLDEQSDIGPYHVSTSELSIDTLLSEQQVIELVESAGFSAVSSDSLSQAMVSDNPSIDSTQQQIAAHQNQQTRPQLIGGKDQSAQVSADLQTGHLLIKGMTCASCVSSVEKALASVDNVEKVQVNLAEQSALIKTRVAIEDLEQALTSAVENAGYQAKVVHDPATQQQQQLEQQQALKKEYRRGAIAGLVIGIPLMLWGVLGGNMMIQSSQQQMIWGLIGLLCFALLATAGRSFFANAWQALKHKRATMDTLVALGTGAAWLYSMAVVIAPSWFPAPSRHVYFEASAMIIGLISLGHYIEAKAKANTTRSLQSLINLQPQHATLVTENGDQTIDVTDIELGMKLRIKPGQKVPVDGKVLQGESYVDESMLTGEPIAVSKSVNDRVATGTLNQDGSLIIEATGIGSDTMLARIIQLVRQAQSSKPAIAKLADQISSVFVPVVVVIALFSALIWGWLGPEPKASYMLVIATTVLIIACPCALGLATPLSVTVGVGKAAEMGILIKDADVLQSASKIDTVVFDKTGTLTEGKPTVRRLFSFTGDETHLLSIAASVEQHSEHPLAKAINQYANHKKVAPLNVSNFHNQRGQGVSADYQGSRLRVASISALEKDNIDLSEANEALHIANTQAWTPIGVTQDQKLIGVITIADGLKAEAKQTIQTLNTMNIRSVMLTGDNDAVAQTLAKQLGISTVISQVLPDEKAQHIEALQKQGAKVAMVGDGVNDAPALALADIGIAMGSGSDVAIDSAQMTLLNASPLAVAKAIQLSQATVKNMRQNLLGAFIYNSLGIPIAAGVLYPAFGFLLSPVIAGAAMALSSITVVSNANRLRLFEPKLKHHSFHQ